MINAIYRYISSDINYSVIFDIGGGGEGRGKGRKEGKSSEFFFFPIDLSPPLLLTLR